MLDKLKECTIGEMKRSYNETRKKIDSICGVGKEEIKLDYLKEDEKRVHFNMRKRLHEYLSKDENVLMETCINSFGLNSSYFFTDKKILIITSLDMFNTGKKVKSDVFYYDNLSDISILEYRKKYHEISLRIKGSLGAVRLKIQSSISKDVFDLLNSKVKSGC